MSDLLRSLLVPRRPQHATSQPQQLQQQRQPTGQQQQVDDRQGLKLHPHPHNLDRRQQRASISTGPSPATDRAPPPSPTPNYFHRPQQQTQQQQQRTMTLPQGIVAMEDFERSLSELVQSEAAAAAAAADNPPPKHFSSPSSAMNVGAPPHNGPGPGPGFRPRPGPGCGPNAGGGIGRGGGGGGRGGAAASLSKGSAAPPRQPTGPSIPAAKTPPPPPPTTTAAGTVQPNLPVRPVRAALPPPRPAAAAAAAARPSKPPATAAATAAPAATAKQQQQQQPAKNYQFVSMLQTLCRNNGLGEPVFDVTEVQVQRFAARLTIRAIGGAPAGVAGDVAGGGGAVGGAGGGGGGSVCLMVEESGPFPNKRDAKQAVSGKAIPLLTRLVEDQERDRKAVEASLAAAKGPQKGAQKGTLNGTQQAARQGAQKSAQDGMQNNNRPVPENVLKEANWVGLLGEYLAIMGDPVPVYQEYQLGSGFSCEVKLPQFRPEPYGSRFTPYRSKKLAKAGSARDAVIWLRAQGHMRANDSRPAQQPASKNAPLLPVPIPNKNNQFAFQVDEFCNELDLSAPEYRIVAEDPRLPKVFSGAAYFLRDPAIGGPIAPFRNIYGKKQAKEECAKGVLTYLHALVAKREEKLRELEAKMLAES
ncbi:hypothetical protein BDY21DRAFT_363134 [Lineolata rhizophorae]|uniref:DRBM domain-containing protein n=1 Tax=Lineolata rhizophorae TaxID=578093 RepID=A0A6A6P386_9PEZI|nr:hypothetical protein BDY21DRAFT_363134 [Lineolata rhizophorae]